MQINDSSLLCKKKHHSRYDSRCKLNKQK
ncbi:hypothetical protein [Paenilisteria newyorkensis]